MLLVTMVDTSRPLHLIRTSSLDHCWTIPILGLTVGTKFWTFLCPRSINSFAEQQHVLFVVLPLCFLHLMRWRQQLVKEKILIF
jgi:hypothetical protein